MITAMFAAAFLFFWGALSGVLTVMKHPSRTGYWHDRMAALTIVFLGLTVGSAAAQFILSVVWR